MIARYASAISSGTLITFALLYAMQGLIHVQPGAASDPRTPGIVKWIKLDRPDTPPPPSKPQFDKKTLTNAPVPPTGLPPSGTGTGVFIPAGPTGPGPVTTLTTKLTDPDGPLISVVRVSPTYPAVAQARALEGWVDVRFDVLISGQVSNIRVIASSDRVFEKSAIAAAQRFRFKAPVVDGVPRVATDVDYRFRFNMED